jgi:hypothetical protein
MVGESPRDRAQKITPPRFKNEKHSFLAAAGNDPLISQGAGFREHFLLAVFPLVVKNSRKRKMFLASGTTYVTSNY